MRGKIYMITGPGCEKCYIGSTTQTLKNRFQQHKLGYKSRGESTASVFALFDKYGVDNCVIMLVRDLEILDFKHLHVFETLWIRNFRAKAVNKGVPFSIKYTSKPSKKYHKICARVAGQEIKRRSRLNLPDMTQEEYGKYYMNSYYREYSN